MDYSDSIDIAVPSSVAFAAIADLPSMGRRSPENTGGAWIAPATGPRLGARFKGTNERDSSTWSTAVKITKYDEPSCFAFAVTYRGLRISRWEFVIEATPGGCRVTEKWRDRRNYFVRRTDGDDFQRSEFTKLSIRTTLERLKAELEQDSPSAN